MSRLAVFACLGLLVLFLCHLLHCGIHLEVESTIVSGGVQISITGVAGPSTEGRLGNESFDGESAELAGSNCGDVMLTSTCLPVDWLELCW